MHFGKIAPGDLDEHPVLRTFSTLHVILSVLLRESFTITLRDKKKKKKNAWSHFPITTQPTLFLTSKSPKYNIIPPQFSHHNVIILCFDIFFV